LECCETITANRTLDIKALTSDGPDIIPDLEPAFKSYNEKQLATVKLPGSSQQVIRAARYIAGLLMLTLFTG
jgi:hypothetical protein